MSPRAPKVCTTVGCTASAFHPHSKCETHRLEAQRRNDALRPNARQRGYDSRWERYAKSYLQLHPACSVCGKPAQVVDHIDGKGPTGPRGYDPTNLRPACKPCHARFATSFRRRRP